MSGPTYNQPAAPSYGEGMADALKAQVQLLTGTGDFASTGSLESLLPLEESIRKKTAQTDTDVLRQTLLGGTTGGGEQEVTYDDQGRAIAGYSEPGKARMKVVIEDKDGNIVADASSKKGPAVHGGRARIDFVDENGNTINSSDFVQITPKTTDPNDPVLGDKGVANALTTATDNLVSKLESDENFDQDILNKIKNDRKTILNFEFKLLDGASSFDGYKMSDDQNSYAVTEAQPIYAKDTDGNIIQDATKAGTTEVTTLPTQRQGDGMVDLLGDKRNVQNTVAREVTKTKGGYAYTGDPSKPPGKRYDSDKDYSLFDEQGNEIASGLDKYQARAQSNDIEATTTTETVYEQADSGRQAGFDESGNFLGLSAFGEDIQAGNLSRQRERDLKDVARLSGTYQDIMEDYKPGTQEALESARSVLESQKDSLTGAGAIGGPQGITDPLSLTSKGFTAAQNTTPVDLKTGTSFTGASVADPMSLTAKTGYDELADITGQKLTAGTTYNPTANVTGSGYTAAQAADPLALSAATSYDPSAGVEGRGYSAVAGLDGGRIEADSLRARLMADAEAGLDQGLTDREERQIAEAARARSTMMGRTFDQSGAIAEAEARVAEDNARKMQNQAFAQRTLGQEADLQQSDLSRGLQAAMQNQAAQNQALQYSSGQDMQAQLANQAATNQALQAGMAAGLSQEALAAQQKQAQEFANQQASNRASEFGSAQALNAALANQQASNRAAEFGVQAGLGREQAQAGFAQQANLANLAAEQQRRESGLQAGLNQEQLKANMAQQKAMADAGFTQQARAMGLEAGLTQEQAEAQLNQQRLMANQQFSQEANKYGAQEDMQVQLNNLANQISNYQFETGAQMDADRLNEQLKQSGILGYIQAAGGLAALEDSSTLDPFQAVLGRGGGGSLQAGQSVFGQAGYGLNSGPAYLNPESGLGYIQNQATNAANMYNAQVAADATKTAGIYSGLGSLGGGLLGGAGAAASGGATLLGGFCWVAREVYGEHNPAWLLFRKWMLNDSPSLFRKAYIKYGERFANFISDKPRLKARIRKWMDSKIRR